MSETIERGAVSASRKFGMKLEVIVIPVSDVDRAKSFYESLGWRLDADFPVGDDFRVVQFTPPGSACSIHFGVGLTSAAPGSAKGHYLVVPDIQAARAELIRCGAQVSDIFHRAGPGQPALDGPDPEGRSYVTYATLRDPDGNEWLLQEITTRFPGRIEASTIAFASTFDLASAMRRASVAHGEHEKRIGEADPDWPEWYADYMLAEQTGTELPS